MEDPFKRTASEAENEFDFGANFDANNESEKEKEERERKEKERTERKESIEKLFKFYREIVAAKNFTDIFGPTDHSAPKDKQLSSLKRVWGKLVMEYGIDKYNEQRSADPFPKEINQIAKNTNQLVYSFYKEATAKISGKGLVGTLEASRQRIQTQFSATIESDITNANIAEEKLSGDDQAEKRRREEAERAEREKAQAEKEKAEKEKADNEQAERERAEKEKANREQAEREERERAEREKAEAENNNTGSGAGNNNAGSNGAGAGFTGAGNNEGSQESKGGNTEAGENNNAGTNAESDSSTDTENKEGKNESRERFGLSEKMHIAFEGYAENVWNDYVDQLSGKNGAKGFLDNYPTSEKKNNFIASLVEGLLREMVEEKMSIIVDRHNFNVDDKEKFIDSIIDQLKKDKTM
ncbi:MAG: hypothetical protein ACD_5C00142G0002 [uncultured bacterium]|nr:MAG: hypothetical protein ACD_5C00142G0002 [uncultured bacterium]